MGCDNSLNVYGAVQTIEERHFFVGVVPMVARRACLELVHKFMTRLDRTLC